VFSGNLRAILADVSSQVEILAAARLAPEEPASFDITFSVRNQLQKRRQCQLGQVLCLKA